MFRHTEFPLYRMAGRCAALLAVALLAAGCAAASASDADALAASLEPGHGPDYYWQALEERGYQITTVNNDDRDYVEYEVVKDDESYEVQIELDEERRAVRIDVVPNAWLSDETASAMNPNGDMDVVAPDTATVPSGTRVAIRLEEPVSSETAGVGQLVDFTVAEPVAVGDDVLIPSGSTFVGRVVLAEKAERPQKPGRLEIDIEQLNVRGVERDVTAEFLAKGKGSHEDDARDIGIGAALGAIVGAIAEGKEGALAGIVLGGGGVFLATKGEDVELPEGAVLAIELQRAVEVPLATTADR